MRRHFLFLALGVATALAACGPSTPSSPNPPAAGDPLHCSAQVEHAANEGAAHWPIGTSLTYHHNPPTSGPHWFIDPLGRHEWGVFSSVVVPREAWVHNLEHGGIVFLFNCGLVDGGACASADGGYDTPCGGDLGVPAASCPDVTTQLTQLRDELKPDQFNEVRVLVTADPFLPGRVAAVAWDYSWVGSAVDMSVLRCFRDARYGRGPESAP